MTISWKELVEECALLLWEDVKTGRRTKEEAVAKAQELGFPVTKELHWWFAEFTCAVCGAYDSTNSYGECDKCEPRCLSCHGRADGTNPNFCKACEP